MFDAWVAMAGALAFTETEKLSRQEYREKYGRWPKDDEYFNSVASTYHLESVGRDVLSGKNKPKAPSMCPSCHSREFKYHQHRLICSYCRTGI